MPSTVAVTGTVPACNPVTTPEDETLARSEPPTDQLADLPVMIAPCASLATAVAWEVPSTTTFDGDRLTFTVATVAVDGAGGKTVTAMLPVTPDAAADIVAEPAPTAETSPLPDTVATAAFDVVHVNDVPATGAPCASFATAPAWILSPAANVLVAGDTAIDVRTTGDVTRNVSSVVIPPLVARILVDPTPTALITPVADTVITAGLSEV